MSVRAILLVVKDCLRTPEEGPSTRTCVKLLLAQTTGEAKRKEEVGKESTYSVGINDINDDNELSLIRSVVDEGYTANLDETSEGGRLDSY